MLALELAGALLGGSPHAAARPGHGRRDVKVGRLVADRRAPRILRLEVEQLVAVLAGLVGRLGERRAGRARDDGARVRKRRRLLRDFRAAVGRGVGGHALAPALVLELPHEKLHLVGRQQRRAAKGAGAEAFLHADDLAAGEAVGRRALQRVPRGDAVAPARLGVAVAVEGWVGGDFERADRGVEVGDGGRLACHGRAAGYGDFGRVAGGGGFWG